MIEVIAIFSTIILILCAVVICVASFAVMYIKHWEREHQDEC